MKKLLSEFMPDETGVVVKIENCGKIKRRLYDMGVTPNAQIKLIKVAPLGDPMCIMLRGYELSIRKDEAKEVVMEVEQ